MNGERRDWELGKRKPKDYYRPMSHRDCRRMIPSGLTEGVWAQSRLEAHWEEGGRAASSASACVSQALGSAERQH